LLGASSTANTWNMSRRAGLGVAVLALLAAMPALARATGVSSPIVYGYPYAASCPAAGIDDDVDRWRMDTCNCTSYVAWALQANGQRIDWFIPGAMDAWNWPHVARLAGLKVGRQARVGAVAVWPKLDPPFGHVAYVTGIERDGGVDVSEYNPPDGLRPFEFDSRFDLSPAGVLFIYVPKSAHGAG
jgi:surface antigen